MKKLFIIYLTTVHLVAAASLGINYMQFGKGISIEVTVPVEQVAVAPTYTKKQKDTIAAFDSGRP